MPPEITGGLPSYPFGIPKLKVYALPEETTFTVGTLPADVAEAVPPDITGVTPLRPLLAKQTNLSGVLSGFSPAVVAVRT